MHQSARCKMRCGRRERSQEVGHFNDMETTKAARASYYTLSMWRRWEIHLHPHLRHIKHRCAQTRQLRLFLFLFFVVFFFIIFFFYFPLWAFVCWFHLNAALHIQVIILLFTKYGANSVDRQEKMWSADSLVLSLRARPCFDTNVSERDSSSYSFAGGTTSILILRSMSQLSRTNREDASPSYSAKAT